jgi:hypothetical protein
MRPEKLAEFCKLYQLFIEACDQNQQAATAAVAKSPAPARLAVRGGFHGFDFSSATVLGFVGFPFLANALRAILPDMLGWLLSAISEAA